VLQLQGVCKRFGRTRALSNVDVTFNAGEVHAILGENGAGKSTLMNVIYGLVSIDEGSVRLHGEPVRFRNALDARRAGIGMVHQEFTLVDGLSVAENLTLALTPPGRIVWRRDEVGAAATRLADEVGLDLGDLDAPVGTLPVGTRQRLEIIKALACDTKILILDEPTAVLTPAETTQLFVVLRRLRKRGTAVLFISHKLPEIMEIADRVTVMRQGRIVSQRERAEGIEPRQLAELMVGQAATVAVAPAATPPATGAPRLVMENLRLTDQTGHPSLPELSLTVQAGEIVGIAGVDGNGQHELFGLLTGLRAPSGGRIVVDGRLPAAHTPEAMIEAGIGQIPPDRRRQGAVPSMSVHDNVLLNSALLKRLARGPFLFPSATRRIANDIVDRYAITTESLDSAAGSLSGGNLQRLIVGRALLLEPRVLVAFNPTRGLDFHATRTLHDMLKATAASGTAMLLLSTDLDEIVEVSHRVFVLYRGRLGPPLAPPVSMQRLGSMMAGDFSC
jgi:simple sugar transport system ATP-binding protein